MAEPLVTLAVDGPIATVTLNRPDKLNSLTPDMIDALAEHATRIDADTALRCVILTAAGEKAFCVGADINAWSALTPLDMWRRWTKRGHQVFDQWARLRVPVIAAINGHALGGGLELAAVADIRVADRRASFGLPEAGIATCPGWSGTQRLTGLIGPSRVKYMALTGRRIGADEAWRVGLTQELADPGTTLAAAQAIAADITRLAPVSVQLTKQLVDGATGAGLAAALEGMAGALAATTQDAAEGLSSFREKRAANYEGK
jgi:enoyl-CoA hydratase/carnithine racemase